MLIDQEYMLSYISEEIEQITDYKVIFTIFATLLRYNGCPYSYFRQRLMLSRSKQLSFDFSG